MSRIDDLIKKYCPNGVEFKTLGEIGTFIRGNGLQKKDFADSGVGCIHYGQIYTYYGTYAEKPKSFVSESFAKKLKKARHGDLVIATTSENDEDVCKAVVWLGKEEIVISGDSYIYRHSLLPKYVAYFFQTDLFQKQKMQHISGTKVRRVSGASMGKFLIPIPPLEIQQEIVRVLDAFTKLEAELEAELEARQKQYAYYRDQLLTFDGVEFKALGELIIALRTGLNPRNNFKLNPLNATEYYVTVRELTGKDVTFSEKTDRVDKKAIAIINNRSKLQIGDILFSGTGTIGRTALIEVQPENWNMKEGIYAITPNKKIISSKFLLYALGSAQVVRQLNMRSSGSTVVSIPMTELRLISIPIPPLDEQERIVSILDKFHMLVNDLSQGLPGEITARRQQYEYYRDKLLHFKEVS